ncbi:MAG: hypothetical protein ACLPV8_02010 [Steroidobacteraceae bacterium]
MKISEMTEDDAKQHLYDSYMNAHAAFAGDDPVDGPHPSRDVAHWVNIAATGGTNSEKRIEKGEDDEQPELTAGGNSGNGGASPAQDSAAAGAEDDRIRMSGSADIAGDLALASARRSNPARIRAMNAAIPGLDRLK